jgi:hypothetical protein
LTCPGKKSARPAFNAPRKTRFFTFPATVVSNPSTADTAILDRFLTQAQIIVISRRCYRLKDQICKQKNDDIFLSNVASFEALLDILWRSLGSTNVIELPVSLFVIRRSSKKPCILARIDNLRHTVTKFSSTEKNIFSVF